MRLVLLIEPMRGTITRGNLKAEDIRSKMVSSGMPVTSVTLVTFMWRGIPLEAFWVATKVQNEDCLNLSIQVPLRREAVQLSFGGLQQAERQLRESAEQVLSSLDGETVWR